MRLVSFFNTRKPIRVEVFAKTDLGRTRDHNEDRFLVADLTKKSASLIPGGEAHQITKDQSLMQRLVEAGELTEEEAAQSERRNIILQALGPDPKVKVDLTHQEVRRGDILVLCSDGLSGQVKKEEIPKIVTAAPDLST